MSFKEKIKKYFKSGSKEVAGAGKQVASKAESIGKDGYELAKDAVTIIGDKATDVSDMVRYKIEQRQIEKDLNRAYQTLGEISLILHKTKNWDDYRDSFDRQINKIHDNLGNMDSKKQMYDKIVKEYSDTYEVRRISKELSLGNAVIEQVSLSDKSNMADKMLKEVLLPKEVLISAIRRGEEVIIPDGNTKMLVRDVVTLVGKQEDVEKVVKRLTAR